MTSNGKLTVVNFSKSILNLSDLNIVVDDLSNQIALGILSMEDDCASVVVLRSSSIPPASVAGVEDRFPRSRLEGTRL